MLWTKSSAPLDRRRTKVPTRKIEDFLTEDHQRFSPLQKLLTKDQNREAWTQEFKAVLPRQMRSQCQVTDLRGPSLLVSCSSAAIATKLRFLAPQLLPRLKTLGHFSELKELQIRVSSAAF